MAKNDWFGAVSPRFQFSSMVCTPGAVLSVNCRKGKASVKGLPVCLACFAVLCFSLSVHGCITCWLWLERECSFHSLDSTLDSTLGCILFATLRRSNQALSRTHSNVTPMASNDSLEPLSNSDCSSARGSIIQPASRDGTSHLLLPSALHGEFQCSLSLTRFCLIVLVFACSLFNCLSACQPTYLPE